jgi:uncharacterized membrane protein (UPF0127 family)
MTARRAVAAALVAVGVVALVIGIVALRSDDSSEPSASGRAQGSQGSETSLTAVLAHARPAGSPFADLTEARLAVGDRCVRVVVADTLAERVEGLRGRRDLGDYDGMLFVFDGPTDTGFTMSTVPVALDIGFYTADGGLVSSERMAPCPKAEADCPIYRSSGQFTYALETPASHLPSGSLAACPS